jgi:hypothetical protein
VTSRWQWKRWCLVVAYCNHIHCVRITRSWVRCARMVVLQTRPPVSAPAQSVFRYATHLYPADAEDPIATTATIASVSVCVFGCIGHSFHRLTKASLNVSSVRRERINQPRLGQLRRHPTVRALVFASIMSLVTRTSPGIPATTNYRMKVRRVVSLLMVLANLALSRHTRRPSKNSWRCL